MKKYSLKDKVFLNEEEFHASVFSEYFDSLYNYGLKISGDSELVKDCIQELFFRMWKNKIESKSKSIQNQSLQSQCYRSRSTKR